LESQTESFLDLAIPEAFLESINATTGIQNFLLASIEGVTFRTHVDKDIFTERGFGLNNVATTTGRFDRTILGMDIWLHAVASKMMSPQGKQFRCTTSTLADLGSGLAC